MIKRVIVGSLIALTLVGAGIAIGASVHGDWGWHRNAAVISDGSVATHAGQTIVVRDGHWPAGFWPAGFFFFPLFGLLFFPLGLILVFWLFRRGRWRGPWRNGGGGPGWLKDCLRRAHEREATDAGNTGSA